MNAVEKIRKRFGVSESTGAGGFLFPDGKAFKTAANHIPLARLARTTVSAFIKAGGVRYHISRGVLGLDLPPNISTEQKIAIISLTKENRIDIIVVSHKNKAFTIEEPDKKLNKLWSKIWKRN